MYASMYQVRNDGRWHCPVAACTAVYATQPELGKHVAKRHTYTSDPTITYARDSAGTTRPVHQRTASTSSMQPPIRSPTIQSPQLNVAPSVRSADRHIPRHSVQTLGQVQSVEVTSTQPQHPQTITYDASQSTAHSNLAYPLISQPSTMRRRSMYVALRDVTAWPQIAVDILHAVLRQNFKSLSVVAENQAAIMATMFSIFKDRLTTWYQLVPEDDGQLYPIFLRKVGEFLQVPIENMTPASTLSGNLNNSHVLSGQAVSPTSQPIMGTSQISTPPQTPIIPGPEKNALSLYWTNNSAEKQVKLFREFLRTAKDSEGLKREWEAHRSSLQKAQETERSGSVTVRASVEHTQGATPICTPPTDSGMDLNAMIEARIQNARLKRKREEEAKHLQAARSSVSTDRETVAKKLKGEPIVLSP